MAAAFSRLRIASTILPSPLGVRYWTANAPTDNKTATRATAMKPRRKADFARIHLVDLETLSSLSSLWSLSYEN